MLKSIFTWLHGLKNWVEGFAQKPYALWALFWVSFIEASLFPIPPDILLVALGVGAPRKAFVHASICTAGSVAGAFLGYYIGYALFESIGRPVLSFYGVMDQFGTVLAKYRENGVVALIIAGFTPIPFKAFTIAAGFNQTIDLWTLAVGSIIGRAGRFFLVGALLFYFGPNVRVFLDKYFDKVALALLVIGILGFLVVKWLL